MRWGMGSLLALAAVGAGAQMHVVKKPETVVRAVGVYEWTGEEGKPKASRLMPVTLFIDGHLEDASVYLARPVPFALETGTIFELDQAGKPEGLLELSFARHLSAEGGEFDDGWMGFGAYKPLPKETLVATKKKSGPLSKIEVSGGKGDSGPKFGSKPAAAADKKPDDASDDPDRPTMKRRSDSDPADTAKATTTDAAAKSKDTAADDPDRPTMKRKSDADSGADASTSTTGTTGAADTPAQATDKTETADPDDKAERPTLRKRTEAQRQQARKQHDSSSVTGVGSLNDDPDRPSLHRGKPAGAMDDSDIPALTGLPADMKQQVAVSDAAKRPMHDFARAWQDDTERVTVQGKLQAIARTKLAEYDASGKAGASVAPAVAAPAAQAKAAVGSTPAARAAARRKAAAAAKAASGASGVQLSDEVLKAYTLSYGGAATYFYSATAAGADGVKRYVSVVAQQEEIGDLRAALTTVTDERHLDRMPQLRLVDAVDVEASNRASLLMELRAQKSRQFALYRVIGAEAQQTFVSGITE